MSPSTIYDPQQQQHSSSSSRPSPLKIKKDSHFIQKSSSSSSSSSVASSSLTAVPKNHHQQQRHPVIIYTHSPRVIHTKARDFMALVQKLTGLEDDQSAVKPQQTPGGPKSGSGSSSDGNVNNINKKKLASGTNQDDNDSSSVVTGDENYGGLIMKDVVDQGIGDSIPPAHPNPYNIIDFPIFTPNSTEFYYPSSRPSFYTFPNPVISFANYMGNFNASPSFHHHHHRHQVIKGGSQEDY